MSVKPVIMVLYTNDAVEVRYSDQSRLHVLPCGTSFTFHTQTDSHPVHGMSTIQQRSSFVTSQFRNQLISALDFRNRFAERPFLCSDLIAREEIVNLYAKIDKIAWPKTACRQHCEILEDGSVRILSIDEFASVILSPHRKDFTVCYLSVLSQEKQRDRVKVKKNRQTRNLHSTSGDKYEQTKRCDSPLYQKKVQYSEEVLSNTVKDSQTPVRKVPKRLHGNYPPGEEDLNISPITQASRGNSPSGVSHASGSPVTPQDTVKDGAAKFRPFSTPTEEVENIDLESDVFHVKHGKTKHLPVNREGSFLGEDFNHVKIDISNSNLKTSNHTKGHSYEDKTLSVSNDVEFNQKYKDFDFSGHSTVQCSSSEDSGSSGVSDTRSRETRRSYCWVTRHISRDECPLIWSYAVKMAEQIADKTDEFRSIEKVKEDKTTSSERLTNLRRINKDDCVLSEVPCPLPLTCKGQHLHKGHSSKKVFDDGKDPLEDWTTLSQGCLKVILVDGVIYRIVRLQTINSVEVYPGDGSVLVSQGMSAHFFLHMIPSKDKVEERTYSVKSPPQSVAGNHSVKTLMNRAHRLLAHVRQELNMPSLNTGLCCWKHEDIQLEEPLSTVLLEECSIPGYGRFTAMSNGQIRILFNDRTALDMTCDFSKRLQNCLDHSSIETSVMLFNKRIGMCRLLLPNGQYQMVDIQHPGQYKKYIQMAKEWSDWVNSSPGERRTFYRERLDKNMNLCVDRELQKIKCFNYVVDNTVLNRKDNEISASSAFRPYGDTALKPRPGILRNVEHNTVTTDTCPTQPKSNTAARSVQIHSPPHKHDSHRSASSSVHLESGSGSYLSSSTLAPPMLTRLNPIGQSQPINFTEHKNDVLKNSVGQRGPVRGVQIATNSRISNLDGFNAVRQALLKTSNVIKDLDAMLDKR